MVEGRSTVGIDGQEAIVLDVDVAPGWTWSCKDARSTFPPSVPTVDYASATQPDGTVARNTVHYSMGVDSPIRMILLDLAPDDTMLIEVRSSDPAQQAAFVERAMPIVESMRFAP